MNQLRTEVYGLPAMTFRPFEGRDIDYLMCLVKSNRSTGRLEHYSPACGRAVENSTEFRLTFDGASDEAFLRQVYRSALGREPDPRGFAYWLDLLSSGQIDRVETVFFVAFGTELRTNYSFGGK